ncbi:MAG: threonine synthase [Acutalibacter sp.]
MLYKSTRNSQLRLEASQVIAQGISDEGGLFVPESFPDLSKELSEFVKLDYPSLAKAIFGKFLTDFTQEEIAACVDKAYTPAKFGDDCPVKLVPLTMEGEAKFLLELWHGPTCAFKDMALQILPQFLTTALKKAGAGKEAVILTATSGDTGKAALEGFKDVEGTRILVFYPRDGVSPMQKRQMATQEGENVSVCAIEGNFDDAQSSVKKIFTDPQVKTELAKHNLMFSSANSINWGRLLPQIVYYVYAYLELVRSEKVNLGDPMDVVVPTGNFGNILAAYYARKMGLPVRRFVCASNANKVLTDFIRTGTYDRRREFHATASPSMDILISSNLERLLYDLAGEDSAQLACWMQDLAETGVYSVGEAVKEKVQELFYGGFCGDGSTFETIRELWDSEHYLCDTHTAVAVDVYRQYLRDVGVAPVPAVIASTANPYKFSGSVLEALQADELREDDFENLRQLEKLTGVEAPVQLRSLQEKPVRFSQVIPKEGAAPYVLDTLGIGGQR